MKFLLAVVLAVAACGVEAPVEANKCSDTPGITIVTPMLDLDVERVIHIYTLLLEVAEAHGIETQDISYYTDCVATTIDKDVTLCPDDYACIVLSSTVAMVHMNWPLLDTLTSSSPFWLEVVTHELAHHVQYRTHAVLGHEQPWYREGSVQSDVYDMLIKEL